MSDFEQVREQQPEYRDEAAPADFSETLQATPPAHDEPESRRRLRVERMLHRGRLGGGYPRPFRSRF